MSWILQRRLPKFNMGVAMQFVIKISFNFFQARRRCHDYDLVTYHFFITATGILLEDGIILIGKSAPSWLIV